jgi:hypothetical protein
MRKMSPFAHSGKNGTIFGAMSLRIPKTTTMRRMNAVPFTKALLNFHS